MNINPYDNKPGALRLGTRASLLAVAQSQQVADRLMQAHPGLRVELVKLQSQGDRDLQTPLSEVSDKSFFSDELDAALASGHVDFCVHSWKDIEGSRPAAFVRAAVPVRAMPHDVVLFRGDIAALLRRGKTLRIGTSSRRRQTNTADFLQWALPNYGHPASVAFHNLRGPVHERVARVAAPAGKHRLDGVVLALAGLERLWDNTAGRNAIESILRDARWMVMPLSECPAAAAQGALAVETLRSNQHCADLLAVLHHPQTEELVGVEQQMLTELADDHPAFGASAVPDSALGFVARMRGRDSATSDPVYATRTANAPAAMPDARGWDAQSWRQATHKQPLSPPPFEADAVFIAHADAYNENTPLGDTRCWTSGPESWARLARQGIWIEGCADNLGFEAAKPLLQLPVLQLPDMQNWAALTHDQALAGWADSGVGAVIATYTIQVDIDPKQIGPDLNQCTHFFWASARQYALLKDYLPTTAHHACGPGKTYQSLKGAGLNELRAFASRREWQQWLA